MKTALVEMLTVYILLLLLFQPVLHDIYSTRANAVEMVLDSAIQKAANADNGHFTPEIIAQMRNTLEHTFLLDGNDIRFIGTTELTPRGEYIEGTLSVKSTPRWLLRTLFGSVDREPPEIVRYAKQMSEAIVR
ncbi:hypothetical protein [Paenibacillus radicis (ex Xue et al. 2023)]|uniref:Pilus assembly protein n=1 Tax=Paenibacillus radicis (ex Xue et al. 2023) TaxID=2972489 RepID=A0ABT1YRP2_9BACL|nr:hypothetical protein [Paenibacillus radicis (ex Xue et al. 2023)]MCR8635843.1 hypothetical protein [Paenibacillus radicis (ex Xue et al. 2023)]